MVNWEDFWQRSQVEGEDVVYVELMLKYGFIRSVSDLEKIKDDISALKKVNRRLRRLIKQKTIYEKNDFEKIKIIINQRRIKTVREQREKKQLHKERELTRKREKRKEYIAKHIDHVGRNYSGLLQHQKQDSKQLKEFKLPSITNETNLANMLGVSLSELKWLTYHRNVSKISHYFIFEIDKKTGGKRKISAPKKKIKNAQKWIYKNILQKIAHSESVHGFIKGKSTVTNAKLHIGQDFVINTDLEDFFPSITFPRVLGLFRSLGYSGLISTILSLLCTESDRKIVEIDDQKFYASSKVRCLPQGAPTSPAISNLICRRLDIRFEKLCKLNNIIYTRYADDMTFSCNNRDQIGLIFALLKKITFEEGFTINNKKTRIFTKSNRQEVTGIVVNEKFNISRRWVNQLRLEIFQYKKAIELGLEPPVNYSTINGKLSYLSMVNPRKGKKYRNYL